MTAKNLVLQSAETPDGNHCVDIFQRPDGKFGFEAYRRDAEDGRGWFPLGHCGGGMFESEAQARRAAVVALPWVEELMEQDRRGP